MTDNMHTQDPADIERDIRRTQEDMSRTVDRIGSQFSAKNVLNSLLDKANGKNIDPQKLVDAARRNPLALAMIAGGVLWLASGSEPKMPSLRSKSRRTDDVDQYHRDYVSHMASVDWREGEDPAAYQRRRDIARANYFMVERRHDEDEGAFRKRLDDVAEAFRSKRRAWADQIKETGSSVSDTSHRALDQSRQMFDGNPIVGGLIAAAAGAAIGAAVPVSRMEAERLGQIGGQAREMAAQQTDKLAAIAREKKDELVERVEGAANAPTEQPDRSRNQATSGSNLDPSVSSLLGQA
jgi:hypothetical protein